MDIDLDELISTDAANTAKAGIKFQPKGKPKPKPKSKTSAQPEPKSIPTPSTQLVEAAATTEEQPGIDANQIIGNVIHSLQSSTEISQEQNAESFVASESPNDFRPESTTVDGSMDVKHEGGRKEPELIDNIDAAASLESIVELDPLTRGEAAILNDNEDFQIGPRASKFKPKPKAQSRKKTIADNIDQDVGPAQTDFMESEPVPTFTPDEILGTSSIITSDDCVNEEANNGAEISQMDSVNESGRSSERLTNKSNKVLRLVDEADSDEDYVPENESLVENIASKQPKSKPKSKSKKPLNENEKPARKRKKDIVESTEVPKKKFSHSTKRNKRPVNPDLLRIPEDEFEMHMHSFPLKDLIRLREHQEKIEQKEASLSRTDATDQSDHAQNATYYNYGTHMKRPARMKWTKHDTELFYQAIQQFGTDLSLIAERFPGRTREQIKLKYKKENKQQRLRMESALSTPAKDYSHFELVIERLKQERAEDSENNDSVLFAGEDDDVVATDINEGGNVKLQKEVKDMEPDASAADGAESPIQYDDEEFDTWSQYKSEI